MVSKTRRAESARREGELAQADRLLERASRSGLKQRRAAASESLLELRAERLALVATLHDAALAVHSRQGVPVAEELAWYEAAFALSVPDDPAYAEIRSRVSVLRIIQRRRLEAHARAHKELVRDSRSCETGDLDSALRELVSLAYEADAAPPASLAWKLADVCFEAGRYDQAAGLAERARRLEAYHHVPSPSADSLVRLALSLHRTGVSGPLVAAVSRPDPEPENTPAVVESRPVARARPAQPRPPARARPNQPPASRGSTPVQVAAGAPDAVEDGVSDANDLGEAELEPEPEPEPPPPTPEARDALRSARRLHLEGDIHGALVLLDRSTVRLADHPELELLVRQREDWMPARTELIRTYLSQAESALAAQRPDEAAGFYERILALDPDHAVSRDRLRRLEHLQSLREP